MECSSLAFGEVGGSNLLPNLISVVVVANCVVGRGNQAGLLLLNTTQKLTTKQAVRHEQALFELKSIGFINWKDVVAPLFQFSMAL